MSAVYSLVVTGGALALEYGLGTLTMVAGPALGGIVISALGLTWAYSIDSGHGVALAA